MGCSATVSVSEARKMKSDLLCDICLDIVTDFDEWLTSDATEQQIADWIDNAFKIIGEVLNYPDLVQMCEVALGAQIPNIIDDIVNNNLNPQQICDKLGAYSKLTNQKPVPLCVNQSQVI